MVLKNEPSGLIPVCDTACAELLKESTVNLLRREADGLKRHYGCESGSSAYRRSIAVPYEPFDPQIEVRHLLTLTPHQHAVLALVATERVPGEVGRIRTDFRNQHRETFLRKMLGQQLGLAKMQVEAHRMLNEGLVTTAGTTLEKQLHLRRSQTPPYDVVTQYDIENQKHKPAADLQIGENHLNVRAFEHLVDEHAKLHRFPGWVVEQYRKRYGAMVKHSHDIHAFRNQHPNDKELFKACFGFVPAGEIEVIQGPLNLHFRCRKYSDYRKLFAGSLPGETVNRKDAARARSSIAAALLRHEKAPVCVRDGLTAEKNIHGRPFTGNSVKWFDHEVKHVTEIFYAPWMNVRSFFPLQWRPDSSENARTENAALALEALRVLRADLLAKNEILAHLADGADAQEIRESLGRRRSKEPTSVGKRTSKEPKAAYDFVDDIRASFSRELRSPAAKQMFDHHVRELYDEILKEGIKAIEDLQHSQRISRPVLKELLRIVPLERWQWLLNRLTLLNMN